MDEVWLAGINKSENSSNLYNGQTYWTISPAAYFSYYSQSNTFAVYFGAMYTDDYTASAYGVRPVINLRADTKFKSGSLGTADSPYEVVEAE